MKKDTLLKTALLITAYFTLPVTLLAQNGSLDLSFDTDGMVITNITGDYNYGHSVAIQSDGKIVVAGFSSNGIDNDFALVRYNTNGSLDNTFDTDGMLTTAIDSFSEEAYSVAIQNDGKILVAGFSYNGIDNDFALVRYNANGSLDTTFDTDGIITTTVGISNDFGQSLAIQSDGKIVIAGYSYIGGNSKITLMRYNSNGSLDNTFDTDGILTTSIGTSNDFVQSLAIQSDGKIVVAGNSYNGANYDFALVRYNTNGSLDNTFDADGIVLTAIGTSNDYGHSLAIQSDGKIVMAGYSSNGIKFDFALLRYNTNGSLDNTFDTDGILTTSVGNADDYGMSVVIQSDGKIFVAGVSYNGANNDFALVCYNTNGSLDNTFDTDGIVTTPIGTVGDEGYSVVLQSDGKIVVAGLSFNNSGSSDFAVVRYNNNTPNGTNAPTNQTTELKIYPNPFSTQTILQTETLLKDATLIVYNSYGQSIKEIKNITGQNIIFQQDNLPSGLYFIRLTQDNKIIITNRLVITD